MCHRRNLLCSSCSSFFQIYQKGGFLRSDKLIATADCKLIDLEEKVHIHESVDLMEGRKQTGGKLNFRVIYYFFLITLISSCVFGKQKVEWNCASF